jgi:preprotein translocase SecE subunit
MGIMSSGVPPQVELPQVDSAPAHQVPASSPGLGSYCVQAFRFVGEVKQEFWRISWTTPQELRTSTKVVLGGMLLAGFVIYGVDLVLQGALSLLNSLSFWIAG